MEFTEHAEVYFKSKNVVVTLFPEKNTINFDNLEKLYEFVENECDYWEKCINGSVEQIRVHFNNILNWLKSISNPNTNEYNQPEGNINNIIKYITLNRFPAVFSITSRGKLIKETYMKSSNRGDALCDYLFNNRITSISDFESFKGTIQGFLLNDSELALAAEREAEFEVLSDLHNKYNGKIEESYSKFLEKTKEEDKRLEDLNEATSNLFKQTQDSAKELLENKRTELDNLTSELFELEKTYKEKIALSAPAEYWKELSGAYNKKGNLWTQISIGLSCALITLLTYILYHLPKILTETNNKITYDNIRGTIIFVLIVSTAVYAINLFVKLALSAYHLSRDAKEREQLTYVYLALIKENAIDTTERNIVLQSVFSRADTGLLKGDSSPTLPDGILSQVLKNIGGK